MSTRYTFDLGCMGDGERSEKMIRLDQIKQIKLHVLEDAFMNGATTDHIIDIQSHSFLGTDEQWMPIVYFEVNEGIKFDPSSSDIWITIATLSDTDDGADMEYTYLKGDCNNRAEFIPFGWLKVVIHTFTPVNLYFKLDEKLAIIGQWDKEMFEESKRQQEGS